MKSRQLLKEVKLKTLKLKNKIMTKKRNISTYFSNKKQKI